MRGERKKLVFVLIFSLLLVGIVSAEEVSLNSASCVDKNGVEVDCKVLETMSPFWNRTSYYSNMISNQICSNEKNLIANGFEIITDDENSENDNSMHILLNYTEIGLCEEDYYLTEFSYSISGKNMFKKHSIMQREGAILNGVSLPLIKRFWYTITSRSIIVRANMDSTSFPENDNIVSSNILCSTDIDCKSGPGMEICIDGHCASLEELNYAIKEINEDDNCIQQEFEIKLFKNQLIPLGSPENC